jgi:hypothetical protein
MVGEPSSLKATKRLESASSPAPVRFLVTREGRAPVQKLIDCGRDYMEVAVDLRLYGPAVGPRRPPSERRLAPLFDGARRLGHRLHTRHLVGSVRPSSPRVVVFADIERLSWDERRRASLLWDQLNTSPGVARVLNHPTRSMCRYELLRALRVRGWNDFDAYRLSESRLPERYPVFLRGEDDHDGAMSPLLESKAELLKELERRRAEGRLREGTLIVEFCDTADDQGLTRKYGAVRVGRHVLPRHVFVSRNWMVKEMKADGVPIEEVVRFETEQMRANPHAEELMKRFELAGIEYGRIDYALKDGRIQVWEINTNPTLLLPAHFDDPHRGPLHKAFARRLDEALGELGTL